MPLSSSTCVAFAVKTILEDGQPFSLSAETWTIGFTRAHTSRIIILSVISESGSQVVLPLSLRHPVLS